MKYELKISKTDIKSNSNIFLTLKKLESFLEKSTSVISFAFNDEYINPIFFILMNSIKIRKELTIILKIDNFKDNIQHHILRFFAEYIDLDKAVTHIKKQDIDFQKYLDTPYRFKDKKIHILTSVEHKEGKFINLEYGNSLIPLVQIKNLKIEQDDKKNSRIEYYKKLSLDSKTSNENYEDNIKNIIGEILIALKLDKKNLVEPFANIFSELINNIEKHTDIKTNAFLAFYKTDTQIKFIFSDDDEKGFLDKFEETLENEFEKLKSEGIEESTLSDFKDTLNNLYEEKYESVIKELFSQDDKTLLNIHQIPRVTLHFGIPLLIKILKSLSPNTNKLVEIFLNSKKSNKQYRFVQNFQINNSKIENIIEEKFYFSGTHIIISLPIQIEEYIINDSYVESISLELNNNDYKSILSIKNKFQDYITKNFIYIDDIYKQDLFQKDKKEDKYIITKYIDKKDKNKGDFFRRLFSIAHIHNIKDICIFDIDFKETKNYFDLIVEIIYKDNQYEQNNELNLSLNILFYDKFFPSIFFLGGKDFKEYKKINKTLKNFYTISKKDKDIVKISSKIFYRDQNNYIVPFELFKIARPDREDIIDIFEQMVENFLIKNSLDIHLDTNKGFHTDKFYKFKKLFENSIWIKRLAFRLALELKDDKNIIVSTDKFAYNVAVLAKTFLDNDIECIYIKDIKKDKSNCVLLSSVLIEGKETLKRIEKYKKEEWISIIRLNFLGNNVDFKYLINFTPKAKPYKIGKSKHNYCIRCEDLSNVKSLYTLDSNETLKIKNLIEKKLESKIKENSIEKFYKNFPNMLNSIYFGHTERGSNHFLYYIETINFYIDNKDNIRKDFLYGIKKSIKFIDENIILLVPFHSTNTEFVNLVNEIIFENNATIMYVNQNEDLYLDNETQKYSFYFVDDEISSGNTFLDTFKKLYSNCKKIFDGLIVLIDRTSKETQETLKLCIEKKQHYYAFLTLDVPPIKLSSQECFLCKRQEEYSSLLQNASLDFMKFRVANKYVKLNIKNYNEINIDKLNLDRKIKNFINLLAVDYVGKNFTSFEYKNFKDSFNKVIVNNRYSNFDRLSFYDIQIIEKFKLIVDELIFKYLKIKQDEIKDILKEILNFECDIAILKALSYPPLSYYKELQDTASLICIRFIRLFEKSTKEEILYKIKKIDLLKNDFIDLYNVYADKYVMISKINICFNILGYLKEVHHLDEGSLSIYLNKIVYSLKKNQKEFDKTILHHYPFAVKMSIFENEEKNLYFFNNFKNQYKEILKNNLQNNEVITYLDALYIESYSKALKSNDEDVTTFEDFISHLKNTIDATLEDVDKKYDLVSIFINTKFNFNFKNYEEYIKDSKKSLKDVLNDYENLDENNKLHKNIALIYQGAITKSNDYEKLLPLKYDNLTDSGFERIDDTWNNYYHVESDDETFTIIKLSDIDISKLKKISKVKKNDPIWYKPIGCLIFKHKKDKNIHLSIARAILTNQKILIDSIKKYFSYHLYQEQLDKVTLQNEYENIITNINHSAKRWLEIDKIISIFINNNNIADNNAEVFLNKLKSYTNIIYKMASIVELKFSYNEDNKVDLYNIFYDKRKNIETNFLQNLKSFTNSVNLFNKDYRNCELIITKNKKRALNFKINKDNILKILISELVINAIKQTPQDIENPKIKIDLNQNYFIIKNQVKNGVTTKQIKDKISSSKGMGHKMIGEFLKLQQMKMSIEVDERTNILHIKVMGD